MPVLTNISQLAVCPHNNDQSDIGLIEEAALVWENGIIQWIGVESDLPDSYSELDRVDVNNQSVVPGLIDCHTHLAFGGWREDEFSQKINGETYIDIAKAGGGIASTVAATRTASSEELRTKVSTALDEMLKLGVTTVECKSGYGLNEPDELKQLSIYQSINHPIHLVASFLGAHIVPAEYKDNREAYITLLCNTLIPIIKERKLAEFCDIFVEDTAYMLEEAERILAAAKSHGFAIKVHADQLSDGRGAELAAQYAATSAEHLEFASERGIAAMADKNVIAVSLPIASLYLNQAYLQAPKWIKAGVKVAVATDFNPGSSPSYHLPLALTLACCGQRMTPHQALKGATTYAAQALKLFDRGCLAPGYRADFALINARSINFWVYHFQANACVATYIDGKLVHSSKPS